MSKTILITGSTDGLGLATATALTSQGHTILLHGRTAKKLEKVVKQMPENAAVETYKADLSHMSEVDALANEVSDRHSTLDILINNAGVFKIPEPITPDGFDLRFVVNTIAPYLLTQKLLPLMDTQGRVVNLSSAAQAPVSLDALNGNKKLSHNDAYAQSKLALTMWSRVLAGELENGPAIIAVNPGSMLASNMVKEAYGVDGQDMSVGVKALTRAALTEEFANASGKYFDNDSGRFAAPHPDALDPQKSDAVVNTIKAILSKAT